MILTAECPEINVSQCHFVHHKYYRDWLELKLRPPNTLLRPVCHMINLSNPNGFFTYHQV